MQGLPGQPAGAPNGMPHHVLSGCCYDPAPAAAPDLAAPSPAGQMRLHSSPPPCRIHTIDVNDPAVGFGSEDPTKDATQHRLWKKYVTFHKVRPNRFCVTIHCAPQPWAAAAALTSLAAALGLNNPDPTTGLPPIHHHLQGFSTDEAVISAIAAAAASAKTVLVMLDSEHSYDNVQQELDIYCTRFVTVGS